MVLSRIGSLVTEPLLKRLSFIRYADYSEFLAAARDDPKLDTLSEQNNTYRTLLTGALVLTVVVLWGNVEVMLPRLILLRGLLLLTAITALFLFAYRKQTTQIAQRVKWRGIRD